MARGDVRDTRVGRGRVGALAHAETALGRMVPFFDAPIADLAAATAADPAWALPHLMHAGFLLTLTEPGLQADVEAALQQAAARLAHRGVDHGRGHLAALPRCRRRDRHGARADWQSILDKDPRDPATRP